MKMAENIKSRREQLKLSQEYVAEQLNVSRQAVSKWETGQSEPTAGNLVRLAEVLELSLTELVDPQPNPTEQAVTKKQPNLILHANLVKWAIIWHAAFGLSSALHIRAYLEHDPAAGGSIALVAFDLIMLTVCSVWMTSNHRFESDRQQRRRNVNTELCYCVMQTLAALLSICFGLRVLSVILMLAAALFYILYVNPKIMHRKLTK